MLTHISQTKQIQPFICCSTMPHLSTSSIPSTQLFSSSLRPLQLPKIKSFSAVSTFTFTTILFSSALPAAHRVPPVVNLMAAVLTALPSTSMIKDNAWAAFMTREGLLTNLVSASAAMKNSSWRLQRLWWALCRLWCLILRFFWIYLEFYFSFWS